MPAPTPIIAVLTPRGRGAVATVRFVGDCRSIDARDRPLFHAANGKPLSDQPLGRVVFGRWGDEPAEEVVVCRHKQDTLDVHCHGGQAAIQRLTGDFESIGCQVVDWQELEARCSGFLQAECLEALTRATTIRTANLLLQQASGALQSALVDLQQADWTTGKHREQVLDRLQSLLNWSDFGLHLTEPWQIVIAGRPNVGKSSLINALVGYSRSIVYDQPGTTRDVVTAETAFDGWPVRLSDTAGIRGAGDEIESAGIERARRQLARADGRVLLIDTSQPPVDDDHRLLSDWPGSIVVAHKCDLPDVWADNKPPGSFRVSSKTGEGVEELGRTIISRLIPEAPPPGTPVPITPRQVDLLRQALQAAQQNDASSFRRAVSSLLHGDGGEENA